MNVPVVLGVNEEDQRNARRVLARHSADPPAAGPVRCAACGELFPCLPRRIAEVTVARTERQRKAVR